MFLLAAERMGVSPADCVVFEDSVLGLEAAERAGMSAVLVRPPNVR
jgi:HAD superfamily hydrolase (TIGR01509 family)